MNSTPQTDDKVFCSEVARADGDPLLGTATEARVWLLLEVNAPWQGRVVEGNDLPEPVQALLRTYDATLPGGRVLFIKKTRPTSDTLRFFIADARPAKPILYEIHLHSHEELLELDVPGLLADPEAAVRYAREEPLFLICANGKRDKCCAKFGLAAYRALAEVEAEATWQSSHIGGHRYAPNVLFLPHSVNYGQLEPQQVVDAAQAYRAGRLFDLGHFRGRTSYDPLVQAAETYLRQQLQLFDLDGLGVNETEAMADGCWRITFAAAPDARYRVTLWAGQSELPRLVSCSPLDHKFVPRYELLGVETLPVSG